MKNKIIKKLMVFGLVFSMAVSVAPASVLAAGTQTESETKQPESDTKEPETHQTEAKQLETVQSETKQPETPKAETPQSGKKEPETKQAESQKPETPQTETKQAEPPKAVEEILDQPGKTARAAEDGELNISGGIEGVDYTVSSGVVTIMTNTPLVIAGDSGWEYTGKIIVEAKKAKLTLEGVTLKSESGSVLTVKEGNKLDLTIDWENRLSVEVGNTHAVTLEKGAELVIGGAGELEVSIPDDSKMAKDFSMSRGDKTDDGAAQDTPSSLKITGGTVVAKQGISVTGTESQKVKVQISGGSVDIGTLNRNQVSLTNDKNTNVYKKILTLTATNSPVEDLTVKLNNHTYGSQGIYTNEDKEIFLYLPTGEATVNADKTEYSGKVTKDDDASKPNEWELKKTKAALEIEKITIPEVEYGYTSDKLTAASVTIKNASSNETTVKAEFAGGQSKYFKLTQEPAQESGEISVTVPGKTSAGAAGTNQEIKIEPIAMGLDAGTYTETLKITGSDGSSASTTVTFTVKKVKIALTAKNVEIDSKVYDGKKAASGTITMPEINGKTPEIDKSKVTYKFNSANVKEANTVTVSNLELTDTWAKNYELEKTEFDIAVKNKIEKAPNKHTKEDLKAPSVTVVNKKGVWQPQLTTYKGQEYLFFGTSTTKLTEKQKKSTNWKLGGEATKKNRIVSIVDSKGKAGMKSGTTYTVWTRFAGDDNHEPSDGEVMAYTTFSVGQNGSTTDANGNKINGLTEGTTYKTGSRLAFGAVGAGMSNTSPKTGDERYLPVSWKVSEEHTWSSAPYEAAFTINQAGSYTLQVTFRKQTYSNGAWTNTSTTTVSKVNFKMAATGTNGTGYTTSSGTTPTTSGTGGSTSSTNKTVTSTAAKTGDNSPVLPLAIIFLASAIVLSGYVWKRRSKTK